MISHNSCPDLLRQLGAILLCIKSACSYFKHYFCYFTEREKLDVLDPLDQPRPEIYIINLYFIFNPEASFFIIYVYNVAGVTFAGAFFIFIFSFMIFVRFFVMKQVINVILLFVSRRWQWNWLNTSSSG